MDPMAIVNQLKELAKEPANREVIVKDQGSLPGLVLFLDNQDQSLVESALEAMEYLSQTVSVRPIMFKELGLVMSLETILTNKKSSPEAIRRARSVLDNVLPITKAKVTTDLRTPMRSFNRDNVPLSTPSANFFIAGLNKKARNLTLQIAGMDDMTSRNKVEEALLEVKGVISFTFNMQTSRVIVRARNEVEVETICNHINEVEENLIAKQVIRKEDGEEVMLSFGTSPQVSDKENRMPTYLDDEEEEIDPVTLKKAVARVGDDGANGNGWLGSIGGYISKTLYW